MVGSMVTNVCVCVKFNYDRLRTDKALGNFRKSDKRKKNKNNVCSAWGPYPGPININFGFTITIIETDRFQGVKINYVKYWGHSPRFLACERHGGDSVGESTYAVDDATRDEPFSDKQIVDRQFSEHTFHLLGAIRRLRPTYAAAASPHNTHRRRDSTVSTVDVSRVGVERCVLNSLLVHDDCRRIWYKY